MILTRLQSRQACLTYAGTIHTFPFVLCEQLFIPSLKPKKFSECCPGQVYNSIINTAQQQSKVTYKIWIGPLLLGAKKKKKKKKLCNFLGPIEISPWRRQENKCTRQPTSHRSSATYKSPPWTPWIKADESFKMSGESLGTNMLYVFYRVNINFKWKGKAVLYLQPFAPFFS